MSVRKLSEDKIRELVACGSKINLLFYESTDSTNLRARELARGGSGDAVLVAASQSAGRGRLGRSFMSSQGGIYMSILHHPKGKMSDPSGITAEAAVRLCRAVEAAVGISPDIKWVNDLYINGKKVAGILTEGEYDENGNLRYYIVGMGINVYKNADLCRDLPIATTLEDHAECEININRLCSEMIEQMMCDIPSSELLSEYRKRCFVIGRNVTVTRGDGQWRARVLDILDDYTLKVIDEGGVTHVLGSGEISLKV